MKVRNGFVSNSSTSSYLVNTKEKKVYWYPYGEPLGIVQEMEPSEFTEELLAFVEKTEDEKAEVLYNENKERFCFK